MKKTVIIALAAFLCGRAAYAQETPAKVKIGGFIRQYTAVDTRAVKAGTQDLYFYMPQDKSLNAAGDDLNAVLSWRSPSLTSRLWIDVKDYKWGTMGITGRVEADFYSLNGTSASSTVAQLRLRRAFVKLGWDGKPYTLLIGQEWHPLAADLPHMTNLESGAPFNPFNRSPQVTFEYKLGDFSLMASALYLNHYLPLDMQAGGKSMDPYKYGLPELFFGASYKKDAVVAKVGVDIINSRPFRTSGGAAAHGIMTAVSPFAFFQYTKGMFQLKAKSILAQSGEQFNLLSGYAVASFDAATNTYKYTPMQDWSSFVSFQYGKKFQVLCMLGYMKQLGTTADIDYANGGLLLNSAADTRIQQAFRATPTVAWNWGKFTLSFEYNLTAAEFGNNTAAGATVNAVRGARGLYAAGDTHWVANHRLICMTKFTF